MLRKSSAKGTAELRRQNRDAILQALWSNGPLSRTDLSDITGLSPASITNIVDQLLGEHLLLESGEVKSHVGRKPILLDLNRQNIMSIAIDVTAPNEATVALINLHYEPLRTVEIEIEEYQISSLLEKIMVAVHGFMRDAHKHCVVGVGITVPEDLDISKAKMLFSTSLSSERIEFAEALRYQYRIPVRMERKVNGMALAELDTGVCKELNSFLYLNLAKTVDASLVLQRKVVLQGFTGDIGHIEVASQGVACRCGRRGCLDTLVGGWAIMHRVLADKLLELADKADPLLLLSTHVSVDDVVQQARCGDELAQHICEDAVSALRKALDAVLALLQVEGVVLGSDAYRLWPRALSELLQGKSLRKPVEVLSGGLASSALLGAAGFAFRTWIGEK
ncbi:ROK family transcriptional regulator [Fodinisporobacter ferrooxydans]|uniref:ROK family transcriptional regulator n=1 Tax=Fodinisporobacter ferrooxydans TaxID=2901836 RepID=A0ABY4CG52_9BACL|nr:ROK family transcriptional regulator [Alicyclobacillaceae bacterium MYW30-H2]